MDTAVREALEPLVAAPATAFDVPLGAGEELARLAQAGIERLCALRMDAVATVEADGGWRADGSSSVTAWLRTALDLPGNEAWAVVRTARALHDELPLTRFALWAGRLSWAHASRLSRTALVTPRRRAAVAAPGGEATLVDIACNVSAADLSRLLAVWAHGVDAAGVIAAEQQVFDQRRVSLAQTLDGLWHLEGLLDPVGGATLAAALDSVVGASLGAKGEDRTVVQVRADALVDLARHALDTRQVPRAGGLRPHLFLHLQPETLAGPPDSLGTAPGELAPGGATVSAVVAQMLACDAELTAVRWGADGTLLNLGRTRRTVPTHLRKAVVARDRVCVFPGCRRPATWCDAHHVIPWARGGPTDLANLCLLCRYHHRVVHGFDLRITRSVKLQAWQFSYADGTPLRGPPERRRARRTGYAPAA